MDYKKKYNEALERVKNIRTGKCETTFVFTEGLFEYIFPELAESKDERIRRELIKETKGSEERLFETVTNEEFIAWLEKQGSQILANSAKTCKDEQKTVDKVEPKFKVGKWIVWLNKCYKVNYNGCGYELIDQNGLSTSLEYGTVDESAHFWSIQDAKDGDVLAASDGSIFIFKEVVDSGCKHYIALEEEDGTIQVNDNFAQCWESVFGVCPATKEQRDTLIKAMNKEGWEFDFEKKELKKIESEIEIPFGAKDSELQEVTYYIPKGFHAEIDDDKVVIKKGKKPTAWSIEDISKVQKICMYLDEAKKYYADITEVRECIDWLKSLKDRVLPKQEWSEEDERLFEDIEEAISKSSWGKYDKKLHISFLKHFRPQPKQEWSEEDENHAIGITQTVDCAIRHNLISQKTGDIQISWLKSLKDRYTWKPSDKQMDALQYVYRNCNPLPSDKLGWDSIKTIELMHQELKKLREE